MPQAKAGDTVTVAYTGKLKDDTVFDSTVDREPLEFTIGDNRIIPSFEMSVVGMNAGETKVVTIPPEEAYGPYHKELVNTIDRNTLPTHIKPQVGQVLEVKIDDSRTVEVLVTATTESAVTIDANLPLAGETLIFEIKLLEIME